MNSKQLANVLIKILGLSIGIHAFPASILAAISGFEALIHAMQNHLSADALFPSWTYSLSYVIQSSVELAAGAFLILRSRWITELLLKNEAE